MFSPKGFFVYYLHVAAHEGREMLVCVISVEFKESLLRKDSNYIRANIAKDYREFEIRTRSSC